MASRKQKRRKGRLHCPRCGDKKIHLLNKQQNIWECLHPRCTHKFVYIRATRTYLALKDEDLTILEQKQSNIPIKAVKVDLETKAETIKKIPQVKEDTKEEVTDQNTDLDNLLADF